MATFSIHASGFTQRLRTRFALVACTLVVTTISTNASIAAPAAVRGYGDLPMAFEHNAGQAESSALFLARGRGYALSLMADGAVLTLRKSKIGDLRTASEPGEDAGLISAHVRMRLAGASQSAKVRGLDLLPGVSHYFVGSDPEHWRTGIANFARVSYENIYPGVDLVYYGNQRELEYDFIVAPKADPGAIRLSFEGIKKLLLDSDGNLLIVTALGEVKQHKPVIYQFVQGVRQPIAGGYRIDGHNAKFWIGEYDATQALVIDPVLSYSTYLGGSSADESNAIAVDAAGAAYVTGDTISTNFPTIPTASFPPTAYALVFVSKLNPAGNALAYSVFLGGPGAANNVGYGIAVDGSGNAYVAGLTDSNAFPVTAGAFQTTNRGGGDGFVTKLNNTGVIVYSTYLGGSSGESIRGIAVDSVGSAYVTGTTQSTLGPPTYPSQVPFPTTAGAFQTVGDGGQQDVFVTKLNPAGSALAYSTLLTGNSYDQGWAIAVDAGGNAYVCGFTHSTDFPVTAGAYQSTLAGVYNVFLTKLNPSGSAPVYSTLLGGNNTDLCVSVAIDGFGSAYIAGKTSSSTFPTTAGVLQGTNPGQSTNAFVAKLNSTGTQLVYGGYLGGSQGYATAIAVGSDGAALVTGYGSVIFPTTFDELLPRRGYPFLTKLNGDATAFIYSTRFGGSGVDVATGIALDSKGSAYVTGYTESTNFRTTVGALQTSSGGGRDAFVAKFSFPVCRRPVRVIPDTGAFIRYLQGITGIALMAGLYPDAEVTPANAAAKIADFNENAGAYDFNGDSRLDALIDGLLYMRYALGHRDSALVANLNVGSVRTTPQIESALAACK